MTENKDENEDLQLLINHVSLEELDILAGREVTLKCVVGEQEDAQIVIGTIVPTIATSGCNCKFIQIETSYESVPTPAYSPDAEARLFSNRRWKCVDYGHCVNHAIALNLSYGIVISAKIRDL